jgi:uncharacterized protein (DUF2164 family)
VAKSPRTRIQLAPERRRLLMTAIKEYVAGEFDEPISDFRAESLLDFFVRELGPPVYNQGVRDAVAFVQDRLGDIEGEIYEPDHQP